MLIISEFYSWGMSVFEILIFFLRDLREFEFYNSLDIIEILKVVLWVWFYVLIIIL